MSTVTVSSDRLKTIRTARKIGRPKLAKMAGMTERQIAKIEVGAASDIPTAAVMRISSALQVPMQTLTGELQLIDEDLEPASSKACTNGCCG